MIDGILESARAINAETRAAVGRELERLDDDLVADHIPTSTAPKFGVTIERRPTWRDVVHDNLAAAHTLPVSAADGRVQVDVTGDEDGAEYVVRNEYGDVLATRNKACEWTDLRPRRRGPELLYDRHGDLLDRVDPQYPHMHYLPGGKARGPRLDRHLPSAQHRHFDHTHTSFSRLQPVEAPVQPQRRAVDRGARRKARKTSKASRRANR